MPTEKARGNQKFNGVLQCTHALLRVNTSGTHKLLIRELITWNRNAIILYRRVGNVGEVLIWQLGKFGKDHQIKTCQYRILRAYGAKNSDHQIYTLPIPTECQFTKFNARQTFLLYGTTPFGVC